MSGKTEQSEVVPVLLTDPPEMAGSKVPAGPKAPRLDAGEEPEHLAQRQAAFDADFSWKGKRLEAFSISRESLWMSHRMAIKSPPLEEVMSDGAGFFSDAIRILWLCSHSPEDWCLLRSDPAQLEVAMNAWADQAIGRGEQADALTLGLRIYNSAYVNQHEAAPSNDRPHGDDVGN